MARQATAGLNALVPIRTRLQHGVLHIFSLPSSVMIRLSVVGLITMPGRPRLLHRARCCGITSSDLTLASMEACLTAPGRTLETVRAERAQTDRQRQLRVYEKMRTTGTALASKKRAEAHNNI
jgi:hypothetical protein